jgi:RES domain
VISGAGTRLKGGRFAPKGTRAVYASLDEDTATREVTARKTRLGGKAQIALKDYPRLTYIISINAKTCVDFRNIGNNAVLKDAVRSSVQFPYERGRQKQMIERSPDTGKVIWWKAPVELTSQHWSNVNRDSSFSSNFPTNEQRLLLMLSARPSASFLLLYVAR